MYAPTTSHVGTTKAAGLATKDLEELARTDSRKVVLEKLVTAQTLVAWGWPPPAAEIPSAANLSHTSEKNGLEESLQKSPVAWELAKYK